MNMHQFSIAPMLDWTDRHCRYFHRLMTKQALLYTEMVTTGAIIHGDKPRHLDFNPEEHPVALQLGGSDPKDLATCSKMGQEWGYDEINLNVGCPSDRVQSGSFGACLMKDPNIVSDCVKAMRDAVTIPITVKHRIGVDDHDSYEELVEFVGTVSEAGCDTFIIHARKAWLQGLSPKENREIPPLMYDVVYQIKQEFPQLKIIVNGGILTLEETEQHLEHCDGVMIGREAYQNPWMLANIDQRLFGEDNPVSSRYEVVEQMIPYVERHLANGGRVNHISRHILGLFNNQPGARRWRRVLSEKGCGSDADASVLKEALEALG